MSDETGCAPDLVAGGANGLVTPAGDVDALASALFRVTTEPGLAESMGAAGRERIQAFSFDRDTAALRKTLAI